MRPTLRAGGQGRAVAALPGIQRLWRVGRFGFFRFNGDSSPSHLPLTRAVGWLRQVQNLVYFCLDEIEYMFYNLVVITHPPPNLPQLPPAGNWGRSD